VKEEKKEQSNTVTNNQPVQNMPPKTDTKIVRPQSAAKKPPKNEEVTVEVVDKKVIL
jgi:hypothetical protein